MKETQSASLASQSFVFELDAYTALKEYLGEIAQRLPDDQQETLEDIEYRLAEIFRERLSSPMMVVTERMVREAIEQMGRPSDFGECHTNQQEEKRTANDQAWRMRRNLQRSREDRIVAGVCGGVAKHFNIDAALLRLITLLLILFGGLSVWIYVILWIVIPEEPASDNETNQSTHSQS